MVLILIVLLLLSMVIGPEFNKHNTTIIYSLYKVCWKMLQEIYLSIILSCKIVKFKLHLVINCFMGGGVDERV